MSHYLTLQKLNQILEEIATLLRFITTKLLSKQDKMKLLLDQKDQRLQATQQRNLNRWYKNAKNQFRILLEISDVKSQLVVKQESKKHQMKTLCLSQLVWVWYNQELLDKHLIQQEEMRFKKQPPKCKRVFLKYIKEGLHMI